MVGLSLVLSVQVAQALFFAHAAQHEGLAVAFIKILSITAAPCEHVLCMYVPAAQLGVVEAEADARNTRVAIANMHLFATLPRALRINKFITNTLRLLAPAETSQRRNQLAVPPSNFCARIHLDTPDLASSLTGQ